MQKRLHIFRNPYYRPEFRVTNLYIKFPVLYIQVLDGSIQWQHKFFPVPLYSAVMSPAKSSGSKQN